jgi:hypothetical protein
MSTSSPEPCPEECRCTRGRCWLVPAVVAALLACLLLVTFAKKANHNQIAGPPLLKADARQLKETLVTSHLETPIKPGKNVLWCSTFQLVWNEACRYAGGDIHLKDEPTVVTTLNKKAANETDVDFASCLIMSGLVEDGIVDKIRQQLARKFNSQADPDLLNRIEPSLPENGYLAYAYLYRALPFEYPLKRLEEPLTFGSGKVASFGLRKLTSRMDDMHKAEQIRVLDYEDTDEFVIELKPKDKDERIVLAKITPAETLEKTIEAVQSRIASTGLTEWQQRLQPGESVVIPILDFELWKQYDELHGEVITTPGPLEGTPIGAALQSIRFRLDERGAILKSEAAMAACKAGSPPRQLVFDRTFLILLERRDAACPYFALWVDNPELLVPFK